MIAWLKRQYSLKLIFFVAMLGLVSLAYGLALYSAKVYRDLSISDQLASLQILLSTKSQNAIEHLYLDQKRFAMELQNASLLTTGLADRDTAAITAWLDRHMQRKEVFENEFHLKSLIVRDLSGDIFAEVNQGLLPFTGCRLTVDALHSADFQRRHFAQALCSSNGVLIGDILIPVGGFYPVGYLQVSSYAIEGLKSLEQTVDMPLKITSHSGGLLFQSKEWRDTKQKGYLYPRYQLFDDEGFLGANIHAAYDQSPFLDNIDRAQNNFLIVITLVSLGVLMTAIYLVYRSFLPLRQFRNSVGVLLTGKKEAIDDANLPYELRDLVQAYNEMIEVLEVEIMGRYEVEEELRSEKDFIKTTLNSIGNPVIVINSRDNIKLVNPSAESLFGIKQAKLIDTSIHESLILYSNRQTTRIMNVSHMLRDQPNSQGAFFFYGASKQLMELEFSASPMIDLESEDVGFVIVLKDVTEDRRLRRELSYEGSHDYLTRFLNRAAFEAKFEALVIEDHERLKPHVLVYLDLDQFRVVNDTCGSSAGDLLIQQVATIIKLKVRKQDILARLSGDEFGMIIPFLEIEQALATIQDIIIGIQHSPFQWQDREFDISVSAGVMTFGSIDDEYSDLYSKVTNACFLAKQNGGNQFHVIEENDQKLLALQESKDWVASIMKGLTEDRFSLYVQPIMSMKEGQQTLHYEVLIRYLNDDGSVVLPSEFLPTAERYNLIEKIDSWVVTTMIQWLTQYQTSLESTLFSINLSSRSINSPTFHHFLKEVLEQATIDKTALCFEIAETAVVDNLEQSVALMDSIRNEGVRFSLDDFGTGLSSFSYLKKFPADYLKIDGEFIRSIIEDDTSLSFVRSMAEVAHGLNMKVIAVYVESADMADQLRATNIDYIQGYVVGKPVEIRSLLGDRSESDEPGLG